MLINGFGYQFNIKEEIFQMSNTAGNDTIGGSSTLLNYAVIEERQNCGVFNVQLTLKDFIHDYNEGENSAKKQLEPFNTNNGENPQGEPLKHGNEKLLYVMLQAVDLIKKVTKDYKLMNYYICPLNLMITEHYELRLLNFSLIDFQTIAMTNSEKSYNGKGTMIRSQFKGEIKRVQDLLAG